MHLGSHEREVCLMSMPTRRALHNFICTNGEQAVVLVLFTLQLRSCARPSLYLVLSDAGTTNELTHHKVEKNKPVLEIYLVTLVIFG